MLEGDSKVSLAPTRIAQTRASHRRSENGWNIWEHMGTCANMWENMGKQKKMWEDIENLYCIRYMLNVITSNHDICS